MLNPDDSRRLAEALYESGLDMDKRFEVAIAASAATTWDDLPQWIRDFVKEREAIPRAERALL